MALSIQTISTECLPILEQLMSEYFDPNANYERKEAIKNDLNSFALQENSWLYSVKFIIESKSEHLKVYCFAVLHNFIIKNYLSLTEQSKNELKDYIWNNLIKFHLDGNHSLFIQNKLCQMIATIVRLSYPNFWFNYIDDVLKLISNIETTKLGIRLLNITLEELLITSSDDQTEERKTELTRLILDEVPVIVNVLSSIMERSISNKCLETIFFTPPASPIESNGVITDDLSTKFNSVCSVSMQDGMNAINAGKKKLINLKSICLIIKNLLDNIDKDSLEILELTLRCNLTLFNWLPINEFYPLLNETMFELLLFFATFGCLSGSKETTVGILAITAINELLSKNYVHNEFSSEFYLSLFENVFEILQMIDAEIDLKNLDNEYLMKFIDSMRYFVNNQFTYKRYNQGDYDFFLIFLEKLFNLTFKSKWNDLYQQFIEIWLNLLDIFINYNHEQSKKLDEISVDEKAESTTSTLENKLGNASIELFKQVLIKLQYRLNYAQLEELDNEDLNDYGQTELQIYLNRNIELLSRIAQLIPRGAERIVCYCFEELVKTFLNLNQSLGQSISLENKRIITEYLSTDDFNTLDYTLKDFVTLLRIWQRFSERFIGSNFESSLSTVYTFLDQILVVLDYSNQLKLFTFNCNKQIIVQDLNELHQSLLLTLKFYATWIAQYSNESIQNKDLDNQNKCNQLIERMCNQCVCGIMIALDDDLADAKQVKMYSEMIIQSSLLCLLSVSYSIKPIFLLELISIQLYFEKLYSAINKTTCSTCLFLNESNRIHSNSIVTENSCINCKLINQISTLPRDKCTTLRLEREQELIWIDSLSNILLLLPSSSQMTSNQHNNQQEEWQKRSDKHKTLIYSFYAELVEQFKQQPSNLNQPIPSNTIIYNTLKRTLYLFTNLTNNHLESPSKTKQQLLVSLNEFLDFIVNLLPFNIANGDLGIYILNFLISVFQVFRTQIKLSIMDQIIKTILDCISQGSLLENKNGYYEPDFFLFLNTLVEKLFKVFIFIVEQPAATFKIILPNMLDIALDRMYQIVQHSNCFDLCSTFYEFLYKFLLNNSKFFFKTSITSLSSSLNSSPLNSINNEVTNQQYFFQIFEILGNSFHQPNPDLFKQNLTALDALNFRQKLFHKQLFKKHLLNHFIVLFLRTMINNEHRILHDELVSILYGLASADFESFKKICFEFVNDLKCCSTTFSHKYGQLLVKNSVEDVPTFNKQLVLFVNGIRFYKNSNLLIP